MGWTKVTLPAEVSAHVGAPVGRYMPNQLWGDVITMREHEFELEKESDPLTPEDLKNDVEAVFVDRYSGYPPAVLELRGRNALNRLGRLIVGPEGKPTGDRDWEVTAFWWRVGQEGPRLIVFELSC